MGGDELILISGGDTADIVVIGLIVVVHIAIVEVHVVGVIAVVLRRTPVVVRSNAF